MDILLAAATRQEIAPAIHYLQQHDFRLQGRDFKVLITGIGMMATTYALGRYVHLHKPAKVIQAGIGGSFSAAHPPESVVLVQEEVIGDLGVQEGGTFKDLFDMKLQDAGVHPFTGKFLVNPYIHSFTQLGLLAVRGITVNEITTDLNRTQILQQKYQPVVESMEGAALHYVCLMEEVPFLQIRAVSNYVGERDKKKWKMKEAIELLNERLIGILSNGVLNF